MKQKLKEELGKILNFVGYVYSAHIIPLLYLVSIWSCLTVAAYLVIGDLIRAAGIVSAVALTNILRIRLSQEYGG